MQNYSVIHQNLNKWLVDYLEKSGLECFIIGVSGGIDSALVSTLCAETGKKTHIFNIPIVSSEKNTSLSKLHCDWLLKTYSNVEYHLCDLTNVYSKFIDSILDIPKDQLACANTKSRLRMVLLYQYATTLKGLVVGTGNKIEDFGVGFYTKYGDGGVDISPIADFTKTEVREFAKFLNVSKEILLAPPTDGLWEDNRTDENQIGASYEELEWAMDYIDNNKNQVLTEREKQVIDIFKSYRKKNSHKMISIPIFKK